MSVLDKYEAFCKISKFIECSLYIANNRSTGVPVLIKKIKTNLSWNEVLNHANIQDMVRCKSFPKMTEILRKDGYFYIVYERPTGSSLSIYEYVQKMQSQSFYLIFSELIQKIKSMSEIIKGLYIIPEWIFLHRNSFKILHFQPFLAKKSDQEKLHVFFMENAAQSNNPEDKDLIQEYIPDELKKSISFSLGIIAYRLLTGKRQQKIKSAKEYLAAIKFIRQNCERHLMKATNNVKVTSFVAKMLSEDYFEQPNLTQISNFMQARLSQLRDKIPSKKTEVEVQIQKLHLINPKLQPTLQDLHKNKRYKNCCIREELIDNYIKKSKQKGIKTESSTKRISLAKAKQSKLFLPYINTQRQFSYKNRHKLELSVNTKDFTVIKSHKPRGLTEYE